MVVNGPGVSYPTWTAAVPLIGDVCAKIFQTIDFFFNFYCNQIISCLCQKCPQKLRATDFDSEIKRVENFLDFEKLVHMHGLQEFIGKNIQGESTWQTTLVNML